MPGVTTWSISDIIKTDGSNDPSLNSTHLLWTPNSYQDVVKFHLFYYNYLTGSSRNFWITLMANVEFQRNPLFVDGFFAEYYKGSGKF